MSLSLLIFKTPICIENNVVSYPLARLYRTCLTINGCMFAEIYILIFDQVSDQKANSMVSKRRMYSALLAIIIE